MKKVSHGVKFPLISLAYVNSAFIWVVVMHRSLPLSELDLKLRPPCNGEIWERCFHSDNSSNVHFVHATPEKLKTQRSPVISFEFVLEENLVWEFTWLSWLHGFRKAPVLHHVFVHTKLKSWRSHMPPVWRAVSVGKRRSPDGLV